MTDSLLKTCLISNILYTQNNNKKEIQTLQRCFVINAHFQWWRNGWGQNEAEGTSDRNKTSTIEQDTDKSRRKTEDSYLQDILQLVADVDVLLIVIHLRVVGDEGVLRADVDGVVDLPVDVSDLACWMEETLEEKRAGLHPLLWAAI